MHLLHSLQLLLFPHFICHLTNLLREAFLYREATTSYLLYSKQSLNNYTVINENTSVSKLDDLSLKEYTDVKKYICEQEHGQPCPDCPPFLHAAEMILQGHICSLSHVFKSSFPGVTYTAENAKRRLLQMPLATLRLGQPSTGKSEIVVMEN